MTILSENNPAGLDAYRVETIDALMQLVWTQQTLADRAGIGTVAINQLENDVSQPRRATLDVIRRAFEAAGVEFIDENGGGAGVRLRKPSRRR